jgi:hypothetical protein
MVRVPESISQFYTKQGGDWTDRSKFARRDFSRANQTIIPSAAHITHPVMPGPVAKLYLRNPTTPLLISAPHL